MRKLRSALIRPNAGISRPILNSSERHAVCIVFGALLGFHQCKPEWQTSKLERGDSFLSVAI